MELELELDYVERLEAMVSKPMKPNCLQPVYHLQIYPN